LLEVIVGIRNELVSFLESGTISIAPNDFTWCSSWSVGNLFEHETGKFVGLSSQAFSKVGFHHQAGTNWRFIDVNIDQKSVPPEPEPCDFLVAKLKTEKIVPIWSN
jgi:hypothetical protein